jgi:hypothetical protein
MNGTCLRGGDNGLDNLNKFLGIIDLVNQMLATGYNSEKLGLTIHLNVPIF